MSALKKENGDWRMAPRWFLVTIITLGIVFWGIWLQVEVQWRGEIRETINRVPPLEETVHRNTGIIISLAAQYNDIERRVYEQHRDVLRFYLYYSEAQGNKTQAIFFRERLKELESDPPKER